MRKFYAVILLFQINYAFSQCPQGYTPFSNLQFLSDATADGEVLNTAGTVTLSDNTPFQYNTINDATGAKLVTDNGDVKDFTLSGSSFSGALGSASIQLNPSGAAARVRLNHSYNGTVSENNPGTASCNTFTLLFNSNLIVTNATFNFSSLNTAGIAWEYSVIQMLDASGNPFSPISGPSFTPGVASQYGAAGSGYSGQAGTGNFVAASTGTVTNVGTATTASGTSGTNNNMSSFGYSTVGLSAGTQIGGITFTTCLEDVRGTSNDITNFTSSLLDFTISGCILAPVMPVEFSSFNLYSKENYSLLSFSTASETNNHFFTIERSGDGSTYDALGTLKGAGNSSREITYEFTDEAPLKGLNYYRIKQTDFDGKYSYSEVRSVRFADASSITVSPRTTEGRINVTTDMEDYEVSVFSASGARVRTLSGLSADQSISIEDLQPGIYFIRVSSGTHSETVRVIKL